MNPLKHKDFMVAAIEQAKKAKQVGDLPFGAVVVCKGKIVGRGKCENGTIGDVTDHAELLALREACKVLKRNNLEDCIIYCTNEPCLMCAAGIFQAKIAQIIIGVTRDDLTHLLRPRNLGITHLAQDSGYKIAIETGLMKSSILKLFTDVVRK